MKILFLVRHAKSSRDDPSLPDRNRPLNDRGLHDAPMMGQRLSRSGVKPDRLVSSPALRALTTAQLVADAIGYPRQDIAIETGERARSHDFAQHSIAGDALVQNAHRLRPVSPAWFHHSPGQMIRPPIVAVWRRQRAVGQRVAECDDGSDLRGCAHVDR